MKNAHWNLAALGLALACAAPAVAQEPQRVSFGVYTFKKPTEVYKSFRPALEALERGVAEHLGQPVAIDLRVSKTYEECLESFVRGEIDFVRFGPASYVLAKERNPGVELLAVEQEDGKKVCQGVIAVAANSPIRTLADLAGKRFAFGDDQSTIGRFLSQAELVKAGVRASDLGDFKYLGRHDKVFTAVQHGDFDAGALHVNTFEELNRKSKPPLRVLLSFDNVGKPWIARAGLDPKVKAAVRSGLLALTDEKALEALKVSGLAAGTDLDYQPVREGMRLAREFLEPRPSPAPAKDR
ncbi:MAG: PhnD/SsuA/transferrin family substrate-binding protein [Planctomycetota bacterium]